ncbi:hypothetical protein ABVK25_011380 [Lepraria finkii]|uniref:Uncharacterized protein n=1 Tax=Lepraria finkii TaxID=1340010 RepID=A0ABR4AWA3_9LECA
MATPEIKLPAGPSVILQSGQTTIGPRGSGRSLQWPKKDVEKSIASTPLPLQEDESIIYHYLTFETELPLPTNLGPCRDDTAAPEPPDLRN